MKPDFQFHSFLTKLSVIGLLITGTSISMAIPIGYDGSGYVECRTSESRPASRISIEQAYGFVRNASNGIPFTVDFEWAMGVPAFSFTVLEGRKLRHFTVNAETGETQEHSSEDIDRTESAPNQTLADAILAAKQSIQGHVLYAELVEGNETPVYKVGIKIRDEVHGVFVSASSGKVLLTTTEGFGNFGVPYPQDKFASISSGATNLREAIAVAENAVSGRAVSVDFGGPVFVELDDHLKLGERSNQLFVNVIANNAIHTVIVDGDSNKVIEVAKDEYQLLLEALTKSENRPLDFAEIINIAQGERNGRFANAGLYEEDGRLYYSVALDEQEHSFLLFIDAISGTVKNREKLDSAAVCSGFVATGVTF